MKILIFKIGAIGDVLLTTPAIKKIKENFPYSEIHYFVGKKASPILENNPYIDKIFIFEEKYPNLSRFFKIIAMYNDYKKVFKNSYYDYFLDFESSYYSTYISFYINSKQKIGFKIKDFRRYFLNYFYSKRIDFKENDIYITNKYVFLSSFLGFKFKRENLKPILKLTNSEIKIAEKYFKKNKIKKTDIKIMFGISGTWQTKKWSIENWKILVNLINQKIKKAKIIVLWGPGDENLLSHFKNLPVIIIPECNLRELSSIIYKGDILVSNDNGIRHIATALSKKTIGLFGPTNEKGWAFEDENNKIITANLACRPCDKTHCKNISCMKKIKPDIVFNQICKFL